MENQNKTSNVSASLLIDHSKSRRLQAMRTNTLSAQTPAVKSGNSEADSRNSSLSPDLIMVRQMIDQKLAEILASLPAGKQKRMFKIRYGIDIDLIKQLPIKNVLSLMKIQPATLNNHLSTMKRIGDLNYNGEQVN